MNISALQESMATLFQAEFQALIPDGMETLLQDAVLNSVSLAFFIVFIVSLISLGLIPFLPGNTKPAERPSTPE